MTNEFPWIWHETFSREVDERLTRLEVAFVERQLPQPAFRRLLDVACGFGRHAIALAVRGYEVVGVERDPRVVAEARRRGPGVEFVELDLRDLDALDGVFDGVLSLWASFGYFDDVGNAAILAAMARKLRPGGRLVLDLWKPELHAARQGTRTLRAGVRETKRVVDGRLTTDLVYPDGTRDRHDFRLYTPEELDPLAAAAGLRRELVCTWCDESRSPTADDARMQLVLARL